MACRPSATRIRMVSNDTVAVVHNGIIENHDRTARGTARARLCLHQRHRHRSDRAPDPRITSRCEPARRGARARSPRCEGAYAIAVVSSGTGRDRRCAQGFADGHGPGRRRAISRLRHPRAAAGDAPLHLSRAEGDVAEIRRRVDAVFDAEGRVERPVKEAHFSADAVERGEYRHYMLKEIHEQPRAIADTLRGPHHGRPRADPDLRPRARGPVDKRTRGVQIVACGTSYHAGARRALLDRIAARIPCSRSRSPANTATATRWCRRRRCSSPSRSRAKPPTRWPRCARQAGGLSRHARDLQRARNPRWCANPSWC
jgi:glucosamine--fructose-6-phosphate aminotransferase (isomerizing)